MKAWGDENPDGNVWEQIAAHEELEEKLASELKDEANFVMGAVDSYRQCFFGILYREKSLRYGFRDSQ